MTRSLSALAVALAACLPPTISFEGKSCELATGCFGPLSCDPYTLTCEADASYCPSVTVEAPCALSGRVLYLSPDGADTNAGTDAALPRASLAGVALSPGDVVQLAPGTYLKDLAIRTGEGTAACPIVLQGDLQSPSVLTRSMAPPSHWVVRDVRFEVTNTLFAIVFGGVGNRVERCHFRDADPDDGGTRLNEDVYVDGASDVSITGCDFLGGHPAVHSMAAARTLLRNNTIVVESAGSVPALRLEGAQALVEANDLSGTTGYGNLVSFDSADGTGRFVRNVVHDVTLGAGSSAVRGAGEVSRNTFVRVDPNTTAASADVFADNIVAFVKRGSSSPGAQAVGYNLFWNVQTPYPSSDAGTGLVATDLAGDPRLDPGWVPGSGSAAIDAADPSLDVPAGGGKRADIGARERGATALPDGTYCRP